MSRELWGERGARASSAPSLAALALLISACASTTAQRDPVEWPFPPDKPRVRFVRAFAAEDHLELSVWQKAWRTITGSRSKAMVNQPTGLALSPDERRLAIASVTSGVLLVDLANQTFVRVADTAGYAVNLPFDVAFDADGNLFVSDEKRATVMVYDPGGGFKMELGKGMLVRPTGLAIDRARRRLYVADSAVKASDHHVLEVFDVGGEHLKTIGRKGNGDGEFYFPAYVAVNREGYVAVGDVMNFRIQMFDPEGNFVTKFGGAGQRYGTFARIKGMAFDAFDNLHVADGESGAIQIFNSAHEVLMAYGGRASKVEFFDMPTDVVIDSQNRIYILNFFVGRVNEYTMINTTAADSHMLPPAIVEAPASEAGPAASPASVEHVGPGSAGGTATSAPPP